MGNPPANTSRNGALPYWWMLVGAFFFSGMGILTHVLRDKLPWQSIALVRTSLAFFIAAGMTWQAGASFAILRPATLWVRSIAGSCSLMLAFYSFTHAQSLAQVLVLQNVFPVWVALLSWPVLGTLPRWDAWLAIVCAMAGVIIIAQPKTAGFDWALLAAALSSLTTAIAMLGLHRLHHLDPRAIVTHFSAVSVLFCLAALYVLPIDVQTQAAYDTRTLLMLAGVGITATIGQLFLTKAFAAGPPARVSVVGLSQVAFTALADIVWFERQLELSTLAGILLIVIPTAWLLLRGGTARIPPIIPDDEVIPPPLE